MKSNTHKGNDYLVQWKGYKQRTWEPDTNLKQVHDMIL